MIKIRYTKNGFVVPDELVSEWADNLIDRHRKGALLIATVGAETMIHEIRLRVKEGKIDCFDIEFTYKDKTINVDKDGRFVGILSDGFCDTYEKQMVKLLGNLW